MIRTLALIAILVAATALPVFAGPVVHIHGEVSGTWFTGIGYVVDGPAFIPPDKALYIQAGVRVDFKCTDPFVVQGVLVAEGTAEQPIVVGAASGWEGFFFQPNDVTDTSWLEFVYVGTDRELPGRVVVSRDARVNIMDCDFRASHSCLDAQGGRIWAERNYFVAQALTCTTVVLRELSAMRVDSTLVSRLCNNVIQAEDHNVPPPNCQAHTVGLYVNQSSSLRMRSDAVTVSAVGHATGARFDSIEASGGDMRFEGCLVTVHSQRGIAKGVWKSGPGTVWVHFATLDIARGSANLHWPIGAAATDQANIWVSSSIVQIDWGQCFYFTHGGTVETDYVTEHTTSRTSHEPGGPGAPGEDPDTRSGLNVVSVDSTIQDADPQFQCNGVWGEWTSMDRAEEYYGLLPSSPCIDTGNPAFPDDPDGTRCDRGCFYYSHQVNTVPGGNDLVPSRVALFPPYPNPFNSMVVIPFQLDRSGNVRVVLYDLLGRSVAVPAEGRFAPGSHSVRMTGEDLPAGRYFVALEVNGARAAVRTLLYLK